MHDLCLEIIGHCKKAMLLKWYLCLDIVDWTGKVYSGIAYTRVVESFSSEYLLMISSWKIDLNLWNIADCHLTWIFSGNSQGDVLIL